MPGPPPPSKSYMLKIIDSSDEDEDDDDDAEYDYDYDGPTPVVDDDDDDDDESIPDKDDNNDEARMTSRQRTTSRNSQTSTASAESSDSPPQKKKKKKRTNNKNRKKKKRTNSTTTTVEEEEKSTTKKQVRFDSVMVQELERCLGTNVVPYDGGWPLGLSEQAVGEMTRVKLDDYEAAKQERLRIRAREKGVDLNELVCKKSSSTASSEKENERIEYEESSHYLETRQWDYKNKVKNPLFHLLTEDQRMHILLESSTPPEDEPDHNQLNNSSHHSNSPPSKRRDNKGSPPNNNSSSSSSSSIKRRDSKNKNNHPHSGHHAHHGLHHTGHHINTRSNSHNSTSSRRERSGSFAEQYNETYTQVAVHHVRNELEELRFQRTGEGHRGCTCRKLDVYLLPPGGGGKKAHHRRMKLLRVKDELKKRHLLPTETKTREELELLLHNAVEKEACCSGHDCPCTRNGIECQADVCTCWYDSHQTKDGAKKDADHPNTSSSTDEVTDIQQRCGNSYGMYVVDLTKIHEMRQQIIQAAYDNGDASMFVCRPISPHTPPPMVPPPTITTTENNHAMSIVAAD